MKDEKYWTEAFNNLPDETRNIACAVSAYDNIRYLEREKTRLEKRYKQSINEINEHIKGHKDWLNKEFT
jgi:hypothetical protein